MGTATVDQKILASHFRLERTTPKNNWRYLEAALNVGVVSDNMKLMATHWLTNNCSQGNEFNQGK